MRGWFGVIIRFFRLVSLAVWIAYAFSLAYRLDAIENQDREAYQQDFADIKAKVVEMSQLVSRFDAVMGMTPGYRMEFFPHDTTNLPDVYLILNSSNVYPIQTQASINSAERKATH